MEHMRLNTMQNYQWLHFSSVKWEEKKNKNADNELDDHPLLCRSVQQWRDKLARHEKSFIYVNFICTFFFFL